MDYKMLCFLWKVKTSLKKLRSHSNFSSPSEVRPGNFALASAALRMSLAKWVSLLKVVLLHRKAKIKICASKQCVPEQNSEAVESLHLGYYNPQETPWPTRSSLCLLDFYFTLESSLFNGAHRQFIVVGSGMALSHFRQPIQLLTRHVCQFDEMGLGPSHWVSSFKIVTTIKLWHSYMILRFPNIILHDTIDPTCTIPKIVSGVDIFFLPSSDYVMCHRSP